MTFQIAGILGQSDLLDNYISHIAADPKTAETLMSKWFAPNPDNAAFTKHRVPMLKTLDDWEANGLHPEYNVFRLLEVRGHTAIDAIASRGAKDAIVEMHGVKRPLYKGPDIGEIAA